MAIDVGSTCQERASTTNDEWTVIVSENPANATGTIDTVCVHSRVGYGMSGIEYASFADEGSNVLSSNGDTNGSNLSANGQVTHTAAGDDFVAFAINVDEYIGVYWAAGRLRATSSGEAGIWGKSGTDWVPATSQTFSWSAGYTESVYATGTEAGGGSTTKNTGWETKGEEAGMMFGMTYYGLGIGRG